VALQRGGYLHDLGKIAVRDAVLFKPAPLTSSEFDEIRKHPVVGDQICAPLHSIEAVRPIIRSHHETLDGSGYPDGLHGSAVPLLAQIIAIVDVYDALTTDRPYRKALSPSRAIDILNDECSAGKRDSALVAEFTALLDSVGSRRRVDDPSQRLSGRAASGFDPTRSFTRPGDGFERTRTAPVASSAHRENVCDFRRLPD